MIGKWIEITGPPNEGHVGKFLWSPREQRWVLVGTLKKGDVVYHYISSKGISKYRRKFIGKSRVSKEPIVVTRDRLRYELSRILSGDELDKYLKEFANAWIEKYETFYLVPLEDFVKFEPPIPKDDVGFNRPPQAYLAPAPPEVVDKIESLLEGNSLEKSAPTEEHGTFNDMEGLGEMLDKLLNAMGQIILYGPPGTGKTWLARKYVVEETGENTPGNRWEFITFHQSYSYEEFIEGFRPRTDDNGNIRYEVEDGIFKKMAIKAIWSAIAQNSKHSFESIWRAFMEQYPEGSILKTSNGKQLKIVKYTSKNLVLHSLRKNREYTISINKLRKFWETGIYIGSNESIYITIYHILESLNRQDYEETKKLVLKYLESGKSIDFSNAPKFYIIIDEINRGNISKILGELITLLEKDKRLGGENQLIVRLPYSGEPFAVPPNLYIIGTMNTADRSIALLDVALRRRFAFIEVEPNPEKLKPIDDGDINLAELLKTINNRIAVVKDRDHRIGHSYFMNVKDINDLHRVWYYEVLPLLMEYFYNDWETIKWVLNENGRDSGNVFFEKSKLSGPNGEEAYQLKVLDGDAFVSALKGIIVGDVQSSEGRTTAEETSLWNNMSRNDGD